MTLNRHGLAVSASAVLLLLLAACSSDNDPSSAEPQLYIVPVTQPGPGVQNVEFEFVNPTTSDARFLGYSDLAPLYLVQVHRDGAWHDRFLGWCGTGLETQVLPAGERRRFGAYCDTVLVDWRVGIEVRGSAGEELGTVWSSAVHGK